MKHMIISPVSVIFPATIALFTSVNFFVNKKKSQLKSQQHDLISKKLSDVGGPCMKEFLLKLRGFGYNPFFGSTPFCDKVGKHIEWRPSATGGFSPMKEKYLMDCSFFDRMSKLNFYQFAKPGVQLDLSDEEKFAVQYPNIDRFMDKKIKKFSLYGSLVSMAVPSLIPLALFSYGLVTLIRVGSLYLHMNSVKVTSCLCDKWINQEKVVAYQGINFLDEQDFSKLIRMYVKCKYGYEMDGYIVEGVKNNMANKFRNAIKAASLRIGIPIRLTSTRRHRRFIETFWEGFSEWVRVYKRSQVVLDKVEYPCYFPKEGNKTRKSYNTVMRKIEIDMSKYKQYKRGDVKDTKEKYDQIKGINQFMREKKILKLYERNLDSKMFLGGYNINKYWYKDFEESLKIESVIPYIRGHSNKAFYITDRIPEKKMEKMFKAYISRNERYSRKEIVKVDKLKNKTKIPDEYYRYILSLQWAKHFTFLFPKIDLDTVLYYEEKIGYVPRSKLKMAGGQYFDGFKNAKSVDM